ncbi:MAG: hypothetical protein F7C07_07470 [Desulfurococcales archaeon]|nr:hypothetical protein [Desulfurococcales archaeon]
MSKAKDYTESLEIGVQEKQEPEDPQKRWINKMIKSARRYHKLCPYYDKKTGICLLSITVEGVQNKCDRDGRYENCPVFAKFLEKMYDYYRKRRKVLPSDFQDVVHQAFLI